MSALGKYKPRLKLMSHQTDAINAADNKPPAPCPDDAFAYLMDMGTGKSATLLADWGRRAEPGGCLDLLIVAPAGSYRNWFTDKGDDQSNWSEIRKHLDPGLLDRTIHVPWISGRAKHGTLRDRIAAMLACKDKKRPRMLFVNVESLSTDTGARDLCMEFVKQRRAMVAVDESTTIKSSRGERSKFLLKLGYESSARRILSGLWTPRSPLDLFMQCEFLGNRIIGVKNEWAFKQRYAVMQRREIFIPGQLDRNGDPKKRSFMQIVDYRHLEELQKKVGRYSFRVRAEDCLDLPPKTYMTRDVPLTDEQKRMIKEIKLFGHASIGDTGKFVTVDMVIKQITRFLQINCGYVMDDEHVLQEVKEKRTDILVELLEDHDGKTIIWVPWHPPLVKIVKRLKKDFGERSVAQWHGGNRTTRHEDERRFLGDPQCRFMVATQGAGMRGNTWTAASLAVYYANNYNLEERDQSERRNWRIGQKNRVRYVDLLAEGTIDWKIVENLRKKIDVATMMNQEDYREWLI